LPPFDGIDRVVVGELKSKSVHVEIVDVADVKRATSFANQMRKGRWTEVATIHGPGSTALYFFSGTKQMGYLAIHGDHFYTNARGEALRPFTAEDKAAFFALVPHATSAPRPAQPR
jgi:hypothetical protein